MKKLWASLFGGVSISNYISKELEVGFSNYGPSLGIGGVFSVKDKHEFVHKITLHVDTDEGHDQHDLEWFAVREHDFIAGDFSGMHAKSPSKFMVVPLNPYTYDLVFVDNTCYAEMKPFLQELRAYWHMSPKFDPKMTSLPEHFLKRDDVLECFKNIELLCYWRPGLYNLSMKVSAGAKFEEVVFDHTFELNETQILSLKGNIPRIADDVCCRGAIKYSTAKVPLQLPA
ncbi:MAG TPA: hypothetical protein P5246_03240 [Candidatus Omnitrophota bacterium]|nr:hypothetical protein [Candidatus Omnitrophota bacterium]HSA31261.1 hypothetical protein [Candidatus Omnitrophota bacterium]